MQLNCNSQCNMFKESIKVTQREVEKKFVKKLSTINISTRSKTIKVCVSIQKEKTIHNQLTISFALDFFNAAL